MKPVLIGLVGVSSGLIPLVGDATLGETAVAVLAGLLVWVVLARIVIPEGGRRTAVARFGTGIG